MRFSLQINCAVRLLAQSFIQREACMLRRRLGVVVLLVGSSTSAWSDQKADCQRDTALPEQRIIACSAFIRDNPRADWAYVTRGSAYRAKGDLDRAIADYTKAFELNPSAHGYLARGNAWRAKREFDRAIADYKKALELSPKYSDAYLGLGNIYTDKKQYDAALAAYSKAVELDPKYPVFYYSRGRAHVNLGNFERAIADCSKAIELDPIYALAYTGRAEAYEKKGDRERAIADFRKALALGDSRSADDLRRLGVTP